MDTIKRLRELHAKGTQGEWEAVLLDDMTDATCVSGPDFGFMHALKLTEIAQMQPEIHADATLIAATHNALPALLDAIEAADALAYQSELLAAQGVTTPELVAYRAARGKL